MQDWNLPQEAFDRIQDPFTLKARLPEGCEWKNSSRLGRTIWSVVEKEASHELSEATCWSASKTDGDQDEPSMLWNFMSKAHVQGLLMYERNLHRLGLMQPTEEAAHGVRRLAAYNDPLCNFLMRQYLPIVQEVVGKSLRESYSFLSHYQAGSALYKHTDVPRCPVNVSIQLGSSPANVDWPLFVQSAPDHIHTYSLRPGHAAIYYGTKQPHWRNHMPAGTESVDVLLFHYMIEE